MISKILAITQSIALGATVFETPSFLSDDYTLSSSKMFSDPLTDKELSFSKTEREGPGQKTCEDDPVCARLMAR